MQAAWSGLREKIFHIAWRLSLLLLPWQTRWFLDAQLGGWPWEQGRISIYLSWFLMVGAIVTGIKLEYFLSEKKKEAFLSWSLVVFLFICSLFATRFNPQALRAVYEWWVQVGLLGVFVLTLWQRQISLISTLRWVALSMIPMVALGLNQYVQQLVWGSKWLGIASQDPRNLGVSVIEHGEFRVLRAYGGFPHPNIFGGWLSLVLSIGVWLAAKAERKWEALWWMVFCGVSASVLVLTYSRGAWIAAIAGLGLTIWSLKKDLNFQKQFFVLAFLSILVFGGATVWSQREHVFVRFGGETRLEQKSLNERRSGLKEGMIQWMRRPFLGTGPNAELLAFVDPSVVARKNDEAILRGATRPQIASSVATSSQRLTGPAQPPHNFFVIALLNVGIVGVVILFLLVCRFFSWKILKDPLIWGLVVLASLDHYLWSTWSGQALLFLVLFIAHVRQTRKLEGGLMA